MEYLKKIIIVVLLIVMISAPVYGSEVIPTNDLNHYIEIINPSIDATNTIEVRNNFFVSFNIKEKADLYLTINKIVPVMDTIFLDKILSNEMEQDEFINNLTRHVLDIRGYVATDEMTDEENANYEAKRNEIKETIKKYVENYLDEQKAYESIRLDYQEKRSALKESKIAYDELFKVSILKRDPIQSEGVMPYYEKTIENIKYGAYEMVIELKKEEHMTSLERFDLNIGPRDIVAEDVLIEKEIKLIQPMNLDELEE